MPTSIPAASGWSGWYIGVNVGYGWGQGRADVTPLPYGPPPAFNEAIYSVSHDPRGWLAGVQLGHDWQFGRWVVGVEADLARTSMSRDGLVAPLFSIDPGLPIADSFHTGHEKIEWLGTVRGRLGYVVGDVLIYGTGGLAYGRVEVSETNITRPFPAVQFEGSQSGWQAGWALGVGGEWAFAPNWSARVEYLHFDLGDTTINAPPRAPNPPFTVQSVIHTSGDIVRLGVNYRFR
jgi:outer membrane immunogenic protein